jgi:hypothetical protein
MIKNKFAIGALAAATVASTLAMSNPAEAGYYYRRGGWNPGAAAAVGAIGGLALGAALAAPRPAYGYPAPVYGAPVYAPGPAYGPAPVYVEPAPHCWVQRQRVWDGWGWVWQRQRVCDY